MSLDGLKMDAETLVQKHTLTRMELYTFDEVHNSAAFNPSAKVWQIVEDQVRLYDKPIVDRLIHTLNLQASHTEIYMKSVSPQFPNLSVLEYLRLAPIVCFMHLVREVVDKDFPTTTTQSAAAGD